MIFGILREALSSTGYGTAGSGRPEECSSDGSRQFLVLCTADPFTTQGNDPRTALLHLWLRQQGHLGVAVTNCHRLIALQKGRLIHIPPIFQGLSIGTRLGRCIHSQCPKRPVLWARKMGRGQLRQTFAHPLWRIGGNRLEDRSMFPPKTVFKTEFYH